MKDLIIIGGGAAGCSAGIYAARKKMDTLLITKDFTGQTGLSSQVENYLGFGETSGLTLVQKFKEHLKIFDIGIKNYEEVTGIKKSKNYFEVETDEKKYQSRSVIIASGSVPKKLNAKNEEKFIGKGISYCVTCDETAFAGKTVAVIGAGNAGLESAIELTRFAKKIYILEYMDKSFADQILIKKAKEKPQIEMIFSAKIESFQGDKLLEKIIFKNKKTSETLELSIDGCFIEIGYKAKTGFCSRLVKCNKKGEIMVNAKTMETKQKGIFAAGDVTDFQDKQIIIAAGQGALAALSSYKYLTNKQ